MMTTDSERREVARRLRELDYADLQESLICAYLDALGIDGYADWVGIAHRLADLIEPSCDRDALLALAGELEDSVKYLNGWQGPFLNAREVRSMAQRIRELIAE